MGITLTLEKNNSGFVDSTAFNQIALDKNIVISPAQIKLLREQEQVARSENRPNQSPLVRAYNLQQKGIKFEDLAQKAADDRKGLMRIFGIGGLAMLAAAAWGITEAIKQPKRIVSLSIASIAVGLVGALSTYGGFKEWNFSKKDVPSNDSMYDRVLFPEQHDVPGAL